MAPYISSHLCDNECLGKVHAPLDIHNNLVADTRKQVSAMRSGVGSAFSRLVDCKQPLKDQRQSMAVLNG